MEFLTPELLQTPITLGTIIVLGVTLSKVTGFGSKKADVDYVDKRDKEVLDRVLDRIDRSEQSLKQYIHALIQRGE